MGMYTKEGDMMTEIQESSNGIKHTVHVDGDLTVHCNGGVAVYCNEDVQTYAQEYDSCCDGVDSQSFVRNQDYRDVGYVMEDISD